jgi:hypothetical protein
VSEDNAWIEIRAAAMINVREVVSLISRQQDYGDGAKYNNGAQPERLRAN